MKRLIVVLFVSFLINQSTAQNRWNFIGGANFSSFNTDLMALYGFEDYRDFYISNGGTASSEAINSLKAGGYLAIEHEFMVSKNGFVKTGIKYVSVGDAFFFKTTDIQYQNGYGATSDGKFKMRPRLDYIAIPLNYGIRAGETISIYAGLTPHFNTKNIIRTNRFTGNANDLEEKWDAMDNPVTARKMVFFADLGMSYYLGDGKSVIDLRVSRSISSVYDAPLYNPAFSEAGAWSIELGMGFTIYKKSKKFGVDE